MTTTLRQCRLILAAGSLAAILAGGAAAMPGCEGSYAAESLRPLPPQMVVGLDIRDPSPDHLRLAARFQAGLREAGVTVGPKPNVLLSISSSWLETSSAQPDSSLGQNPSDLDSPQGGGLQPGLPAMPETRLGTPSTPLSPPMLLFRVEATQGQPARIAWVANVRCQIIGADDGARAEELGRVIGGALGRRINREPF